MCQSVITVTVCVCVWACIWCVASTVSSAVGHRRQFRGMRGIHWGISQYLTMVLFLSGEDTEMTAYLGWIMHRILLKSLRGIRVSPVLLTYWRHCNQVLWMTWFISVNWLVFLSANRIMPTILISIVQFLRREQHLQSLISVYIIAWSYNLVLYALYYVTTSCWSAVDLVLYWHWLWLAHWSNLLSLVLSAVFIFELDPQFEICKNSRWRHKKFSWYPDYQNLC